MTRIQLVSGRPKYVFHGPAIVTPRRNCARAFYQDDGATLDEIREAVERLEDTARTARRVLGGACPVTRGIDLELNMARAALRARETPSPGSA